jgi:hypothetical protein
MTRHPMPALRLVVLLAAGTLAAGCGKKTPPEQVTVKGKVVYPDGKPVTDLVLTFHPQEDVNKTSRPSDFLSKKGTFRFDCLPGRYKATVAPIPRQGHAPSGPDTAPGPGPINTPKLPAGIPQKYLSATESDWEIDVPVGGTRDLVLTLKRN